jgi:hypothetical protein
MGTPASRVTTHLSFAEQTHQALAQTGKQASLIASLSKTNSKFICMT